MERELIPCVLDVMLLLLILVTCCWCSDHCKAVEFQCKMFPISVILTVATTCLLRGIMCKYVSGVASAKVVFPVVFILYINNVVNHL